jgi:hypothetical protein
MLAIPDFFLRLIGTVRRPDEIGIVSKSVEIAKLVLEHVILSLLSLTRVKRLQ